MTTKNRTYQAADTAVMLLAAGEGRRMLPLTLSTPKPLLKVGEIPLIEHHLLKLSSLGFKNIVINIAYLGALIQEEIGDGSRFNLNIQYSDESQTGALETAGGIVKALPLIGSNPFIVINADIWTNYDFSSLLQILNDQHLGRIVLVNNPSHNESGDFALDGKQHLCLKNETHLSSYTFSGIAIYKKAFFANIEVGKQALAPILRSHISNKAMDNIVYCGEWTDVGTPERLTTINALYSHK